MIACSKLELLSTVASEQIRGDGDDGLGRFLTGDPTGLHDSSSDSCVRSMTTLIFLFSVSSNLTGRGLIQSSVSSEDSVLMSESESDPE